MLTRSEAPWIEYLEIDEDTGERKLRADTPQEIRDKYDAYCLRQRTDSGELLPK